MDQEINEVQNEIIPLYGFLQGDTMGLLILAYPSDTIKDVALKLQKSALIRCQFAGAFVVLHQGEPLAVEKTVRESGLTALDMIEVRKKD